MKAKFVGIILILGMSISSSVYAEMSSTNFIIRADSISTGGDNTSSSASYILRDSVSQTASGDSSSSSYNLRSGFRPMIFDQIITLDVGVQEISQVSAATALSGTDITVLDSTAFSVGDLVVLVQDMSTTHLAATGKVTAIAGGVITVDQLVSQSSLSIDGTDDVLYRANGSSVDFGTLSDLVVTHRVIVWEVTADIDNGYMVYVSRDGQLTDGTNTISSVTDGSVTAGSEEYGARSSDTSISNSTFDSEDSEIGSALQGVGSESGVNFDSKGLLDLKVAIDSVTDSGTYVQNIQLTASPIY